MTPFSSRLTRQPLAFDRTVATEIGAEFADMGPEVAGLLAASAGCSPYLRGLMGKEAVWLRTALSGAPETAVAAQLAALDEVALIDLPVALRVAKRRVALPLWPMKFGAANCPVLHLRMRPPPRAWSRWPWARWGRGS